MTETVIEAKNLSRKFADVVAVDNLSLSVPKAVIYGFLGPNGSGKSTTIRMLCGLLTPSSGEVSVLGLKLPEQAEQLKRKIGYMTQFFSLYTDLSVEENLQFMARIYQLDKHHARQRVEEALSVYALDKIRHQRVEGMSGGQRQRLSLAAATLHEPVLLFLDEPTSAVDPQGRRDFWERLFDLSDAGCSILVSTHYMDEAERCHQLAILEAGQLRADDSPQQLMKNMPEAVVEISGENVRALKEPLMALPAVVSVAQQGVRMRVLVGASEPAPVDYLQRQLQGQAYQMALVRPSLEDVFVSVTGRGRQ